MKWNIDNPTTKGTYVVDMGAWGVCLGWWNGTNWIEMWGDEEIKVWGWIEVPKY